MTTATQTRRIVPAFIDARTRGDFAAAASHLAPDFSFESPLMRFENPTDYLASQAGLHPLITGLVMISELYGEDEATILFDLHTATPVGSQRTAEHLKLVDGKIASIFILFDASEWRPLLGAIGVLPAPN
jgi:SnoaL-like domain